MNEDEQFAADLRPDSIFGSLGASDFEDEENFEEYGGIADGWAVSGEEEVPQGLVEQETVQAPNVSIQPANSGKWGAAITLFALVGGAAVGWRFGGYKGAAGGALAAGAVRNLYRAQRSMRSPDALEKAGSIRPGLIGLVGLGAGGYLLYTAKGR